MTERILQDCRYAFRRIRRAPGFAFTVIATLALTIGANTALFSLLNAIVFRKLPVNEPDGLVVLQALDERGQQNRPMYFGTFTELAKVPVFETLTLYSGGGILLTEARGVLGEGGIEAVTSGFHEMLGLRPFVGRYFTSDDAPGESGAAAVAVISYRFWQQYYGADAHAIGERLIVSGEPLTVIGVTPPEYNGFYVDGGFGFAVPLTVLNRQLGTDQKRPVRGLNAVGRLKQGISLAHARAAVQAVWSAVRVESIPAGLSATEKKEIATEQLRVESLARGFSGLRTRYQQPLIVLSGITAVLLVIGCANLNGLFLARTAARERQFAICLALGASRGRIIQQFVVETLVLASIGAAVAVPLAWIVARAAAFVLWQSPSPLVQSLTPDSHTLGLTLVITITTGAGIGVLPIWNALRSGRSAIVQHSRVLRSTIGRGGKVLHIAQVALSLVLLVGAALFAYSLANLRNIDGGFRADHVRWSRLLAIPGGYRNQNDAAYYPELVNQLSQVPGVESVALSGLFPTYFNLGHLVPHYAIARAEAGRTALAVDGIMEHISPRFFETMGIQILRGRDFTWNDTGTRSAVTIINETLSRTLFPDGNVLGRRIRVGTEPSRSAIEVVGIVRDAIMGDLRTPHMPVAFRPRLQEPQFARAPVLTFRTNVDAAAIDAEVTKVIKSLGHEYPRRFYSVEEQIDIALIQERLLAGLSSFFAGLAVLLVYLGLHGLLAFAVARRTPEIGVRIALGASRGAVMRMVLSEGLLSTAIGVGIGIPCALGAGRAVTALLFGLTPSNPMALVGAAIFLLVVGTTAGLWPACRAASVQPIDALRCE